MYECGNTSVASADFNLVTDWSAVLPSLSPAGLRRYRAAPTSSDDRAPSRRTSKAPVSS
jgi:hypothetical protein